MDVTEVATAFSKAIRSIEEQFGCKLRMQAIVDSCPLENQLPLANHLHLLVNHMKLDKVDQPPEAEGPPLEFQDAIITKETFIVLPYSAALFDHITAKRLELEAEFECSIRLNDANEGELGVRIGGIEDDRRHRIVFLAIRAILVRFLATLRVPQPLSARQTELLNATKQIFAQIEAAIEQHRPLIIRVPKHSFQEASVQDGSLFAAPTNMREIRFDRGGTGNLRYSALIFLVAVIQRSLAENRTFDLWFLWYKYRYIFHDLDFFLNVFHDLLLVLNAEAWELGVVAHPMETAIGPFSVNFIGGGTTSYRTGAPIPLIGTSWTLTSEATHCLAIEKLSFYNFLIFNKFPEKFYEKTGEKLALVACGGCASFGLRAFLSAIDKNPNIKLSLLMDADPGGLEMISSITYGSQNNCWLQNQPSSPGALWVGLFASEVSDGSIQDESAIPCKPGDEVYLKAMDKRVFAENTATGELAKREIRHMISNGKKFELECVSDDTVYDVFSDDLIEKMTAYPRMTP